ncbi:response regulator transcription factor [Rothia kristinae]|uniref:response regulator transcription factor n=1 Tax=Rothia kristinae TaxID=37923 RepID=UPI0007367D35|nr:response regulator transcription factor [Rothia kristinae]KTR37842.1 MerR family transcriptional regulator [Rothia kristinae]KTR61242.1 MerR family transcriptional regulator [Rothia kristinae]KTR73473.1 MerR family transcriptional regulator [Rothia kristinae]KTR79540.1 MerR family transcriptional regulator [Rothia kristinae]KTR81512.1 MerR family transcriptional regulator [Rothia kristinae]
MSIRVLIADDQDLVRGALAALLGMEPDLEVVAQVGRGDEVAAAARESGAQVALLDIEMPGATGIEACAALGREVPGCVPVIVTTFGRPGYLKRALAAGARGFVVKDTPPDRLAEAVRRVHAGLRVIDPTLAAESLFTPENPLTEREAEVCRAAEDGARLREVAARVHLSPGTVRNHLSAVIGKTGTDTRYEAVRQARDKGWL